MGFRTGSYAKVWSITPMSDTMTKLRISTSRKNRTTDAYEQDFSGFVMCAGTACAQKAAKLAEGDRIRLGDCEVTTKFIKEKGVTYTNFSLFSFDVDTGTRTTQQADQPDTGDASIDESEDDRLPF